MRMLVRMLWLIRGMAVRVGVLRNRFVIDIVVFLVALLNMSRLVNATVRRGQARNKNREKKVDETDFHRNLVCQRTFSLSNQL